MFVNDTVYEMQNPQIGKRQLSDRFNAEYNVSQLANGELDFKFQDFVRNKDGTTINETNNDNLKNNNPTLCPNY
jgi:hypothetical protein